MMRTCRTCRQHYQQGRDDCCDLHGNARYTCDDWSAKPGIWVPISKAKPNEMEKVTILLAYIEDNILWTDELPATYIRGHFSYDNTDRENYRITHWTRFGAYPENEEIKKELERL